MTRIILSLALIVFAAAPAAAQDLPYSQGRLWLVEAADAPPSYLVGTMHSADPSVATPWPALSKVLASVDTLAIEAILDDAATAAMGQAMVLTDGRTLADIAGPQRMSRIEAVGARYGFPPESLLPLKPWAASMVFSVPPSEFARQSAGDLALDSVLREKAEERGIRVYGIETIAEQIALFADYVEDEQLELLDITLAAHGEAEAQFQAMRKAWLAGDLEELYYKATEAPETGSIELIETFMTRLIAERNYRMADRIMQLLDEGGALVAVGALHLPGEEGILAILEDRGYQVSPVE